MNISLFSPLYPSFQSMKEVQPPLDCTTFASPHQYPPTNVNTRYLPASETINYITY